MTIQPKLDFTVSTAAQVYDRLRDAIIRGTVQPGTRLSEGEIGRQLGISRQPVREAFIRLTADGLAQIRPQRGTYISPISLSSVLSARLIREAVESDLIRMVVDARDDALIADLTAQLDQQREAVARDDIDAFVPLDDRFHQTLAVAAGQQAVWTVLEGLKSQMNRLRYITARAFDAQRLIEQHAAIVDALRAGDADAAERNMRLHLRELLTDLSEIAARQPEIFTD